MIQGNLNVANIITIYRILLVPFFVYSYYVVDKGNYNIFSALIILISGLTDFLDGYVARKYNMITELGKILDPIADKLTQFVVSIILAFTYPLFYVPLFLFMVKDGLLLIGGYYIFKKNGRHIDQAKLPGKIATLIFFVCSFILITFRCPSHISNILISITIMSSFIALVYYSHLLYRLYRDDHN